MFIPETLSARIELDRRYSGVWGCVLIGTFVNATDIVQKILNRNVEIQQKDHYYSYLHTQKSYTRCAILMIPVFGFLSVKLYDFYNKYQKKDLLKRAEAQENVKNYPEAFKLLQKAADRGSSLAKLKVSIYYRDGTGTEKNEERSYQYNRQLLRKCMPGNAYLKYLEDCYSVY